MEVRLTPEQEALIAQAVQSGRYQTAEDAVKDAVACWEENERRRIELVAMIDEGDADFEAGRYTEYTDETLADLFVELRREARAFRDARRREVV
jgi:putative addiction module CopG family antidote